MALRHGVFDPSNRTARNDTKELRGAFNYYSARHGLKWQTDIGRVDVQAGSGPTVKTVELRSQLQFVF